MKSTFSWLLIFALCSASHLVSAQMHVEIHGCRAEGNDYTCDRHNFEEVLAAAKSVSVEAPQSDPYSLEQLDKLAHSLGKSIRSDSPDLTFVLAHSEPDGIYYGPGDRKLATIRVYYGDAGSRHGKLVWLENYYGEPDSPWLITVDRLTQQFRHEFKH
jgi:hypothetical protein